MPAEPRVEPFQASARQVLAATQATLAERGFVILYGDQTLGRLTAEYPGRPALTLDARVIDEATGSRLSVTGRRGSQGLAPPELDNLMTAIHERLGEGIFSSPGS
ncbi:hypothetical protein BH688_15685 [Kushneria phosphatilytica]|nr:hypothetical protein BH688_15685 [Kushneria phosphatilytica]